jgi:hypothetical protein
MALMVASGAAEARTVKVSAGGAGHPYRLDAVLGVYGDWCRASGPAAIRAVLACW